MSDSHFDERKEWSARKHELLEKYLDGFVKILGGANRGIVYIVDGFAGPGRYNDGAPGSPLLAAQLAHKLVGKYYGLRCINVEKEKEYFDDLVANTNPYSSLVTNHHGTFGTYVNDILTQIGIRPAIFFLDPFGVAGLEWRHLEPLTQRSSVTELLIRINPNDISRLAGFCDSDAPEAAAKCELLTNLFGFSSSAPWVSVWDNKGTDGLVELYLKRLADSMNATVCVYPIRSIEQELKYYLVFATRHQKGHILMSDTVYHREKCFERDVKEHEEKIKASQPMQQLTIFNQLNVDPTEEDLFKCEVDQLKQNIWDEFRGKTASRQDIHARLLSNWFGKMSRKHVTGALKELTNDRKITQRSGIISDPYTEFTFSKS